MVIRCGLRTPDKGLINSVVELEQWRFFLGAWFTDSMLVLSKGAILEGSQTLEVLTPNRQFTSAGATLLLRVTLGKLR